MLLFMGWTVQKSRCSSCPDGFRCTVRTRLPFCVLQCRILMRRQSGSKQSLRSVAARLPCPATALDGRSASRRRAEKVVRGCGSAVQCSSRARSRGARCKHERFACICKRVIDTRILFRIPELSMQAARLPLFSSCGQCTLPAADWFGFCNCCFKRVTFEW